MRCYSPSNIGSPMIHQTFGCINSELKKSNYIQIGFSRTTCILFYREFNMANKSVYCLYFYAHSFLTQNVSKLQTDSQRVLHEMIKKSHQEEIFIHTEKFHRVFITKNPQ